MKKEVTSRMNRIMGLIILDECKTLKDIADTMNISLRQVRYDLTRINEAMGEMQGVPVIETDNKGVIVINDEKRFLEFNQIQEKKFKCTKEQRLTLLIDIIAFNIKALNLNRLSRQLNVTRVTVKNDLNEIKSILKNYNLNLIYVNNFYIVGDDEDIFEFRLQALTDLEYTLYKEKFEKIEYIIQDYIQECFPKVKLRAIMPILTSFINNNNLMIKDNEFYWLASTILLMLWYVYQGYEIPGKRHLKVELLNLDYTDLCIELEQFMKISLSKKDTAKIKAAISSICNRDNVELESFNCKVVEFIFRLIILFPKQYQDIFINDGMLLKGLYAHIERCYRKKEASLDFELSKINEIPLDAKVEKIIENFCLNNTKIIDLSHENDQQLLKLHFANSLYQHCRKIKKRVLLVSGASKVAKMHLKMVLESLFEITVINVISRYEVPFYKDWNGAEMVLFTEDIPEYFNRNIPVARINIILSNDDFITLNKLNFYPKENSLDLQELYLKLDFLDKNQQLKVINLINSHLQKQNIVAKSNLKDSINYEVGIVNEVDFQHNYMQINDNLLGLFQWGSFNEINLLIDHNVNSGVINIVATNSLSLLFMVFLCYNKLKEINIFSMSNDEIINILRK